MVVEDSRHISRASAPPRRRDSPLAGAATILLIAAVSYLSLYMQQPPAAVTAGAPPPEFSSARASEHLRVIAEKPRPVGSSEHSRVRDYVVEQLTAGGLRPELQRTTAFVPTSSGDFRAGTVENIVARLGGTAHSKSVVLVAHYDTVPTSVGASDAGAGVVALLETLRALRAGPPLKNDVIFLFTDAEEVGSLGAHAFVREHPWAGDVGLALNFEARGRGGPSIMFETSEGNSRLIAEFAKAAPHPSANSLSYEIYRLLPNDTDLSVFKRAGLPGLNFAYIEGLTHYHTRLDNPGELDERSLQHHGSYALALTRHFGNSSFRDGRAGNAIYFDVLRRYLFHYPAALAVPIALAIGVIFIWLVFTGLKRGRLTLAGVGLSFLAFLACLVLVPLANGLIGLGVGQVGGAAYQGGLLFAGFVALTTAFITLSLAGLRRKIGPEDLTVGGLSWWLVLLILASLLLPGASYLLAWPLLFALPALAWMLAAGEGRDYSARVLLFLRLGAVPGLLLLVPTSQQLFDGLGLNSVGLVTGVVILLLYLLLPLLRLMAPGREWLLPAAAGLVGVSLIGVGALTARHDARSPKPDTLFYGLNADADRAVWASFDRRTDRWTSLFLPAGAARAALPEFFSSKSPRTFIQSPAPSAGLTPPQVEQLEDSSRDGLRALRLHVTSTRQAPLMSFYLESEGEIAAVSVNGRRLEVKTDSAPQRGALRRNVQYYGVPAGGVELALELRTRGRVRLTVVDQTYGFPVLGGKAVESRPADIMPAPYPFNDSTFVSKSFTF